MKTEKICAEKLLDLFLEKMKNCADFESECWQNYGGGIEKGDMILSVGLGLNYGAFSYLGG